MRSKNVRIPEEAETERIQKPENSRPEISKSDFLARRMAQVCMAIGLALGSVANPPSAHGQEGGHMMKKFKKKMTTN